MGLTPGSPEWSRLITASKVAAILGVSPWESARSVWHQMRGDVERGPQTEVMSRGHYLEPAILAWWRDQHGMRSVSIPYKDEWHAQWTDQPEFKLGDWAAATPDGTALIGTEGSADWERVLVEAKSAAYDDDWGDPGTDVIPDYYLVQVQWQMHVSGIHRCYVPVIGPRLRFAEYVVDYDAESGPLLEARMRAFYDSLSGDEPPELDDSLATFNTIRKLHPDIDDKAAVECSAEEAAEFLEAVAAEKASETRARQARAFALERMGRANYLECGGVRVARRQKGNGGISLVPLPKNLPLITDLKEAS